MAGTVLGSAGSILAAEAGDLDRIPASKEPRLLRGQLLLFGLVQLFSYLEAPASQIWFALEQRRRLVRCTLVEEVNTENSLWRLQQPVGRTLSVPPNVSLEERAKK